MNSPFKDAHERARRNEQKLKQVSYSKQYELVEILRECSSIFRELQPIKRKIFLINVIKELYKTQDGICPLCFKKLNLDEFDVDHVIPWSWGGGNERNNLQLTHPSCNRSKGNRIENISDLVSYFEDKIMNL